MQRAPLPTSHMENAVYMALMAYSRMCVVRGKGFEPSNFYKTRP